MSQEADHKDEMGYAQMAQEALRGVVKAALKRAASPQGLPGEHHFYITFKSQARGVSAPADLLARHADEMTIVLQHQYWDLAPGETFFSVTLKFGGQPKRLSVPYEAVTRFYDPSVQFHLQFEAPEGARAVEAEKVTPITDAAGPAPAPASPTPLTVVDSDAPAAEKVISLDHFRKK